MFKMMKSLVEMFDCFTCVLYSTSLEKYKQQMISNVKWNLYLK